MTATTGVSGGEDLATAAGLRSGWHVVHAWFDLSIGQWRGLSAEQRRQAAEQFIVIIESSGRAVQRLVTWLGRTDGMIGILAMDSSLLPIERVRCQLRAVGGGELVAAGPVLLSTTSVDERLFSTENLRSRLLREGVDPSSDRFAREVAEFERRRNEKLAAATQPAIPSSRNVAVVPFTCRRDGPDNWFALPEERRAQIMVASLRVAGKPHPEVSQVFTLARGLCSYDSVLTVWGERADDLAAYFSSVMATEYFARYVNLGPISSGIVMSPREILELCGLV